MASPTIEFALEILFREVKAQFTADGTTVSDGVAEKAITQTFGWREPAKQINDAPHIVWVPGDPNGGAGSIVAPRQPGQSPARSVFDFDETFHVEFHAMDRAHQDNEQAQYNAVRVLWDLWWRAVFLNRSTRVAFVSAAWLNERKEARAGAALRAICSIQSPIWDTVATPALPGTQARITVSELSVTDPAFLAPETEE